MIAFISGHLDLTPEEFTEYYVPQIEAAIAQRCDFVVGDAPGADAMAQQYLSSRWLVWNFEVTVYHCARFPSPRHNIAMGGYPVIAVGQSQATKDRAMTEASDFDIAWVRPGKEKSGTADNLRRREKKAKRTKSNTWNFVTRGNPDTYISEQEIIDTHRQNRSEAEQ